MRSVVDAMIDVLSEQMIATDEQVGAMRGTGGCTNETDGCVERTDEVRRMEQIDELVCLCNWR